jgi:cation diffusion facilitator family transporter
MSHHNGSTEVSQRPERHDEAADRAAAHRAIVLSALGLATTGAVELSIALSTGSVALLSDALHNLSDVSTSVVVFFGFRISRRPASRSHPYGYERAEDVAGLGVVLVIWASAVFASMESYHKLIGEAPTRQVGIGIAAAVLGIVGNQAVAGYKRRVGRRIGSATLLADAQHSWLDALASAGALLGLALVAAGYPWGDPIAGFAVTLFIVHVGYEVTRDLLSNLMDGVDPELVTAAEQAADAVPGVRASRVRGRWTGRTLRLDIEADLAPDTPLRQADAITHAVEHAVTSAVPTARDVHCHAHGSTTDRPDRQGTRDQQELPAQLDGADGCR